MNTRCARAATARSSSSIDRPYDQRRRPHVGDLAAWAGRLRSSGICGRWPGSGWRRACSTGRSFSARFPSLGQFTTMALPLQATIVAFACLDLAGGDRPLARRGLGRGDLAPVRGGRGRFAGPQSACGRDRVCGGAPQHRLVAGYFPVELAGGARTRERLSDRFGCASSAGRAARPLRPRFASVNVNKAFDSIEIYHRGKLWIYS